MSGLINKVILRLAHCRTVVPPTVRGTDVEAGVPVAAAERSAGVATVIDLLVYACSAKLIELLWDSHAYTDCDRHR